MKRSRFFMTVMLGVFLASTLIIACGGGGGGGSLSVALLIDSNYVDYDDVSPDDGMEANNLQAHLDTEGIDYDLISGVTSTDFSTALAGKDTLIIPELEAGDLASDISTAAAAVISTFVNDGGTLVIGFSGSSEAALANTLFGYSLNDTSVAGTIEIGADAAGTRFSGGLATLDDNDATQMIEVGSWPLAGLAIYVDQDGNSGVTVIPEGSGEVILLGYDWFDAAPVGVQDGGWVGILNVAIGN